MYNDFLNRTCKISIFCCHSKGPKQNQQSRAEKQTEQLQQRQQELKLAALKAKKAGDLELAKNYLRQAKGLDHLIGASMSGLPVDMTSIPLSPSAKTKLELDKLKLDDDFTIVKSEDCEEESGTDQQIYENLEAQLVKQIKVVIYLMVTILFR